MRRQRGSLEEEGAKEGQQETVGDIPALAEASQPPLPLLSTALFPGIVLDLRALRRFFFSVAN